MENSSPVVDWVLQNSSRLALSVQKVTWIDEWLPGYSDYHVEVSIGGKVHKGRGTDASEQTAFIKAVAESLERAACHGLITHGARPRTQTRDCGERAYAELLAWIVRYVITTQDKRNRVALEELNQLSGKNLIKNLTITGWFRVV